MSSGKRTLCSEELRRKGLIFLGNFRRGRRSCRLCGGPFFSLHFSQVGCRVIPLSRQLSSVGCSLIVPVKSLGADFALVTAFGVPTVAAIIWCPCFRLVHTGARGPATAVDWCLCFLHIDIQVCRLNVGVRGICTNGFLVPPRQRLATILAAL